MDAHQTTIYNALLISSIIIGSIIVFFIVSIIRQQRRNLRLYQWSIEAEIRSLEQERARIAADLHDELGPLLSAIKFKIGSLEVTAPDQETVDQVDEHIDSLVQRMREISNDLLPITLVRKGVVVAIEELVRQVAKPDALEILFTHQDIPELPQERAIHVYRIVTEIIHNTLKHAEATSLKLDFVRDRNRLILQTADNGRGFDYAGKRREQQGLGLRNLLSRTDLLGGSLYVDSTPGKGTHFLIEVPLNEEKI